MLNILQKYTVEIDADLYNADLVFLFVVKHNDLICFERPPSRIFEPAMKLKATENEVKRSLSMTI